MPSLDGKKFIPKESETFRSKGSGGEAIRILVCAVGLDEPQKSGT